MSWIVRRASDVTTQPRHLWVGDLGWLGSARRGAERRRWWVSTPEE